MDTAVSLFLADQAPEVARAHDELYPERVSENIPLSITLLYPFASREELDEDQLRMLRTFFASRHSLTFDIVRVAQWEDGSRAVYGVPEPEHALRSTMRALWELFPEYPPYGGADDPPPHASLTLDGGEDPDETRARVERRLEGVLPVHFHVEEAVLMEEREPDVWQVRETFPFGG
jgi:2'-5' RNA ligase superfamily